MDLWVYIKVTIYGCMLPLSVILNSLIIYATFKEKNLRTIPYTYILNLIIINLFLTTITMPSIISNSLLSVFQTNIALCVAIGYITMLLLACSIWSIALCSIHCYVCILFPYKYRSYFGRTRVITSIVIIWIFCALTLVPPLLGWGKISPGDNLCLLDPRVDFSYVVICIIITFMLPLLSIIYTNLHICIFLANNKKKMARLGLNVDQAGGAHANEETIKGYLFELCCCVQPWTSEEVVPDQPAILYPSESTNPQISPSNKDERTKDSGCQQVRTSVRKSFTRMKKVRKSYEAKVSRILLLMFIIFIACWLPAALTVVFVAKNKDLIEKYDFVDYSLILALSNTCWTPLIQILTNRLYKKHGARLKDYFCCNL